MYKKRWYDGLHDIYEGKNEFEIKFGCFGGDGGSSGGNTSKSKGESDTTPSTGFRGEQSAASPSNQGFSGPTGVGIGPGTTGSVSGKSSTADSFGGDKDDVNQTISDAIQASIAAQQALNNPTNMSIDDFTFSQAPTTTNPAQAMQAAMTTSVNTAPSITGLFDSPTATTNPNTPASVSVSTPTTTQDVVAQDTVVNDGIPGISIGPGTLTGKVDPTQGSVSVGYNFSYAKGGAVRQGIGSIFPYPRR